MAHKIINYNPGDYPFHQWAREVLGVNRLEEIHLSEDAKRLNSSPTSNQLSKAFGAISLIYESFVLDILGKEFGGIASYQAPPSFRFHYCGLGSSVFHRDRDFGVKQGRVNVWIPLTDVWGENSLWMESATKSGEYQPVNLKLGQALIFDGVNLGHGSKINTTSSSRISFDFRFLPGQGPAIPEPY